MLKYLLIVITVLAIASVSLHAIGNALSLSISDIRVIAVAIATLGCLLFVR